MMNANCWFGHGFFWNGPWGMLFGILFWSALFLGMFYIVYRLWNTVFSRSYPKESPLDILREKYARGEINTEEYEERKTKL